MKTLLSILACLWMFLQPTAAQIPFGEACIGTWTGRMEIYAGGKLRDTVSVRLTVGKTTEPERWSWKTEYLSAKQPAVKDYRLRLKDAATGLYLVDEGDGTELTSYHFGNKLYSVFETEGVILTSTYELRENELIFEVTSGKKGSPQSVVNYSVDHLQRVVLRRN